MFNNWDLNGYLLINSSNNVVSKSPAFSLMIVGGSCLWSPASMNLRALAIGIKMLGIVACEASSMITTSKFTLAIDSKAEEEFVARITSLLLTISFHVMHKSHCPDCKFCSFNLLDKSKFANRHQLR